MLMNNILKEKEKSETKQLELSEECTSNSNVSMDAGLYHNCGLTDSKQIFCWGSNNYGQGTVPNAHQGSWSDVYSGW